jgi:hypothetical protein
MHPVRLGLTALSWIFIAILPSTLACSRGGGSEAEAAPQSEAEAAPESQVPSGRFVGNVTETMDAGNYTYVALERDGEQVWAAGPKTVVALGDEIAIGLEMRMDGFHSESLGRTFDAVYFVSELRPTHVASTGSEPGADPHAGVPGFEERKALPDLDLDSIEKAAGGHRVADLWARRSELAASEVVVRGRVVKYNDGILGRNWLHIQDGSGDPEAGTHDLTVTTNGKSAVGDLVIVRGVVAVDRDFGAGYSYAVLVEEAEVEIE